VRQARLPAGTPVRAIAGGPARRDAAGMSSHAERDTLAGLRSSGGVLIGAGIVSIIAGLLAIAFPDITLLALALFAGINLIVLSALTLVDAFSKDVDGAARAVSAVLGVLGLIAGLVILRRPGESLLVLILVIGIWLVVSGTISFLRSLDGVAGRGLEMLGAVCEIVLGILILSLPDLSLRTVAILAGISFIVRGALAVYAGWQLRKAGVAAHGVAAGAT
jgi:uncharacterized membrane protein HdeD (DUF308 family)